MFFKKKSEDAEKFKKKKKDAQLAIQHFLCVYYSEPGTHVN